MVAGALWAGIAGSAAGDPRRQRGDLDDHAQRHRGSAGRATSSQGRRSRPATVQGDQADPRVQLGRRDPRSSATRPSRSTALGLLASWSGVAFWRAAQPHPLRLQPARHRAVRDRRGRSGVNVKRMVVYSMLLSGAVAGLIGMPRALRAGPQLRHHLPDRHRLRRHRGGAAGPQQPGRHRLRRADLRLPQRAGQRAQHPGRHLTRHRRGHPGHHRAGRGRSPTRSSAATGSGSSRPPSPPSCAERPAEEVASHERRRHPPTTTAAPPSAAPLAPGGSRPSWRSPSCWSPPPGVITGADDIDSTGALRAALVAAMPIVLAGLGGLWSERAGVVNIGLEGMMILGTLGAGYFGYHYGARRGVLGAVAFGVIGGVLHARRDGDLRRRPHRLRCGDQHHGARRRRLPGRDLVHGPPGRRPDPVAPAADASPTITIGPVVDFCRRHRRTRTGSWSRTCSRWSACSSTGCRC